MAAWSKMTALWRWAQWEVPKSDPCQKTYRIRIWSSISWAQLYEQRRWLLLVAKLPECKHTVHGDCYLSCASGVHTLDFWWIFMGLWNALHICERGKMWAGKSYLYTTHKDPFVSTEVSFPFWMATALLYCFASCLQSTVPSLNLEGLISVANVYQCDIHSWFLHKFA